MHTYISRTDLDEIAVSLTNITNDLKNAKIFLTGGTGFFGIWLIESFLALNERYQLKADLFILSRNPEKFLGKYPLLNNRKELHFITGDIQSFKYPEITITHVIHAATSARNDLIENKPLEMLDTIVEGTRHLLNYCITLQNKPKILLTSSGAVYGEQPANITHISEHAPTSPNLYGAHSAYGLGKCMAEHLSYQYHRLYDLPIKVARCFAFVGPHLPLDSHFAIGNFIEDCLANRPITVKATKQVFRSYQYPSDLMIWLWIILVSGKNITPYNVGSDEDMTLVEFAEIISELSHPKLPVITLTMQSSEISRYVPSIQFAKASLGLYNRVHIKEAIARTLKWYRV